MTTSKRQPTKKKINPTVYIVFFTHFKDGVRTEDFTEAWLNEKVNIETATDLIGIQNALVNQNFVNPKITNFVPVRKLN